MSAQLEWGWCAGVWDFSGSVSKLSSLPVGGWMLASTWRMSETSQWNFQNGELEWGKGMVGLLKMGVHMPGERTKV